METRFSTKKPSSQSQNKSQKRYDYNADYAFKNEQNSPRFFIVNDIPQLQKHSIPPSAHTIVYIDEKIPNPPIERKPIKSLYRIGAKTGLILLLIQAEIIYSMVEINDAFASTPRYFNILPWPTPSDSLALIPNNFMTQGFLLCVVIGGPLKNSLPYYREKVAELWDKNRNASTEYKISKLLKFLVLYIEMINLVSMSQDDDSPDDTKTPTFIELPYSFCLVEAVVSGILGVYFSEGASIDEYLVSVKSGMKYHPAIEILIFPLRIFDLIPGARNKYPIALELLTLPLRLSTAISNALFALISGQKVYHFSSDEVSIPYFIFICSAKMISTCAWDNEILLNNINEFLKAELSDEKSRSGARNKKHYSKARKTTVMLLSLSGNLLAFSQIMLANEYIQKLNPNQKWQDQLTFILMFDVGLHLSFYYIAGTYHFLNTMIDGCKYLLSFCPASAESGLFSENENASEPHYQTAEDELKDEPEQAEPKKFRLGTWICEKLHAFGKWCCCKKSTDSATEQTPLVSPVSEISSPASVLANPEPGTPVIYHPRIQAPRKSIDKLLQASVHAAAAPARPASPHKKMESEQSTNVMPKFSNVTRYSLTSPRESIIALVPSPTPHRKARRPSIQSAGF